MTSEQIIVAILVLVAVIAVMPITTRLLSSNSSVNRQLKTRDLTPNTAMKYQKTSQPVDYIGTASAMREYDDRP